VTEAFTIGNAEALFNASPPLAALPTLGGTGTSGTFDWGLPFFYGKTFFVVFETKSASGSSEPGPYVAF